MKAIPKAITILAIATAIGGVTASSNAQTPGSFTANKVSVTALPSSSIPSNQEPVVKPQKPTNSKMLLAQASTSLPTGTWSINANSFGGQLVINSVDAQGNLTGTVYGQSIVGFWDGVSNKITFIRVPSNPAASSQYQIYTGYLFRNSSGPDSVYTLTGYFEAFAGTGATARRVVYGWYAQIRVIG